MTNAMFSKVRQLENNVVVPGTNNNDLSEPERRKNPAWNMMRSMGWTEGRGIGAQEQGRVEPVAASQQVGRRGLGAIPVSQDLAKIDIQWQPGDDNAAADANLMYKFSLEISRAMEVRDSVLTQPPIPVLDQIREPDGRYVDNQVIDNILRLKSCLDSYEDKKVREARTRCNPYETLQNGQYMNRAALKLANINSMFDFMFTCEERRKGVIYFADVCAGPGGFTEYLLSMRPLTSVGYGFTLAGKDDFKKDRMLMGPSECFFCHYGTHGDGNIYSEENMASFASFVRSNSEQADGLHLVTADGGFDVTGQENNQEMLAKRLYLCQCLCALRLLRTGGDFICKLFDMVTPFSMELVFLMSVCFDDIYMTKPVTSRPANSERYLVGISRRGDDLVGPVIEYLRQVNNFLDARDDWQKLDLVSMMPDGFLDNYADFVQVMRKANNEVGEQQALALSKLHAHLKDLNLIDDRQCELKLQCLDAWRLSDDKRPVIAKGDIPQEVNQLLTGASPRDLLKQWRPFREDSISNFPKYSYKAMVVGSAKPPVLLYSRGHGQVYYFNTGKDVWRRTEVDTEMEHVRLSLPRRTVVLGQLVCEYSPRGTKKQTCLHLLDALIIYGDDVRDKNVIERHEKLRRMVAVLKEAKVVPLSVPQLFRPYEPQNILKNLRHERLKGYQHEKQVFKQPNGNFFIPSGLWLVKITREPWIIHMSRSNFRLYYFNISNRQSQFEPPSDGLCSYSNGIDYLVMWEDAEGTDSIVPWSQFCEEMQPSPHHVSS